MFMLPEYGISDNPENNLQHFAKLTTELRISLLYITPQPFSREHI